MFATNAMICAPQTTPPTLFIFSHKKNKKEKKKKKTHAATRAKRGELLALTINPGYSNAFKECNPQKAHTTGCIIVKELKHVHATLRKGRKTRQNSLAVR